MLSKRIIANIIDFGSMMVIFALLGALEMFAMGLNNMFELLYYLLLFICCFLLILKDVIKGKSIGKRIMKTKVISISNKSLSVWRLVLRNITILVWPVEILLLLTGKKRIGDRIAKTDVAEI